MARTKRAPPTPMNLPPNGQVIERRTISVAYYWPMEGYGIGSTFQTFETAMAYAKRQAPDAESTGNAVMHIIERVVRTTVVRPEPKPE